MKPITQYQADDGTVFITAERAAAHDVLCVKIAEAVKPLGVRPIGPGCGFENGTMGYVHHDVETVDQVATALIDLAKPLMTGLAHMLVWKHGVHPSHPSRAISEGPSVLCQAWYRIDCIDEQGREFGQPFYKNNPDKFSSQCCLDLRGSKLAPVPGVAVPSFGRGLE